MSFIDDPCVRRWVKGLAASTVENRLPLMEDFFRFIGTRPSEAVDYMRKHPSDYKYVDLLHDWVDGNKYLSVSSKMQRVSTGRGLFLANRAPLPKVWRHRFHSDKEPVICDLSVDDFKKILSSCSLSFRAAFLVQFQSGSGIGELLYINTHHAEQVWNEIMMGKRIIQLSMPGRKHNRNTRPYYTFIGADAIKALKNLFHSRGWKKDTVLFRNQYRKPITAQNLHTYFRNHAIKLGIIKQFTLPCPGCGGETVRQRKTVDKVRQILYVCTSCDGEFKPSEVGVSSNVKGGIRYKMKTHELRDLFRTEWHRAQTYAGVDADAGNFFMGHTIDALKYDKIMRDKSYGLEQYRKALPFLNILSEDPRVVKRSEIESRLESRDAEIEVLRKEMNSMRRKVDAWDRWMEILVDPEKRKKALESLE